MNATVLVFAPLVLAYATALLWCVQLWLLDDGYFAHGPLVPLVMAIVIWTRREQWRRRPAARDLRGLWLLVPALLLHLAGAALTIDSLSAASLVLAVPGAAWLALGRQRLAGLWPALWMTAFAVPMPLYVTGRVAFELKEVAVRGGVWFANATGLAVHRDGAFLHVPGRAELLDVADPCGGLRSLLAMITLVYCIAFFLGPRNVLRRSVLLALAAPLAIAVNVVRIAAICHAAHLWGVPFASGAGHDWINAGAWVLDLALVLAIDTALGGRRASPPPAQPDVVPPPQRSLRPVGIALWAIAVPLLWLSLYRPYTDSKGRAETLPERIGAFSLLARHPLGADYHRLLGTDDATWRTYESPEGEHVFVVALFHASNWKSVHPPHICLAGSDMDQLDEREIELAAAPGDGAPGIGETARAGRLLLRRRGDGRPYLSLFVYGDRSLCTGSYATFFLHHAPRALVRSSNDGFLLRVEAWTDGEGGLEGAEARCRQLLSGLIAAARSRLP